MTNFYTTHTHDYRWPHSTCLIPKAEAPSGHCVRLAEGDRVEKPWCGRDAPPPPPLPQLEQELPTSPVCPGLTPTTDKPWCQRGLLAPLISPRQDPTAPQLRVRPDNCPSEHCTPSQANGCYNGYKGEPTLGLKYNSKESNSMNLGHKECYQNIDPSQNHYKGFNGSSQNLNQSKDPRSKAKKGPEGCYEEPSLPSRPWCNNNGKANVVAARVGAAPQQDTSLYNQPNKYLQQLCDKYPRPTAVVTATPRDELMRQVYADRYRTTYQSDYSKNSDDTVRLFSDCDSHEPSRQARNVTSSGGGFEQCKCGCGCSTGKSAVRDRQECSIPPAYDTQYAQVTQSTPRPSACRPAPVSHNFHFSCCFTAKQKQGQSSSWGGDSEHVGRPEKLPPWISEYSDNIDKTAHMIMDLKLLHPNKKRQRKF